MACASQNVGANATRMNRAVFDLGGDMLRDTLYQYIKPSDVMSLFHASSMFHMDRLNPRHKRVLRNASEQGDYREFDITLLYSLLRNITLTKKAVCPTAGWGNRVSDRNYALGDDVERIREMRMRILGNMTSPNETLL